MDYFSGLLEFWAPSPAVKESVLSTVIDVGSEIALRSIDGEIYNCFVLVPMKGTASSLVKCKYILAVTNSQIIELYPHSTKFGVAIAAEVHELKALVKLKYKKGDQGILLLEYRSGKLSKILMDDPVGCVNHIKVKMNSIGINDNVKNKSERIVENAQGYFQQAKAIETQFSLSPSVEYVQEMMDLLRRSTEKFAEINDESYKDVMDFIKTFLQRPDVSGVLDASVKTPQKLPPPVAAAPPVESAVPAPEEDTYASTFGSPVPDMMLNIDAELVSLQNALTYHFEEDDHNGYHLEETMRSPPGTAQAVRSSSAPVTAERCELTEMLEKMNLEFDSLLSSFEDVGVSGSANSAAVRSVVETAVGEKREGKAGAAHEDAAEFQEVDFDQTLHEIVNA